MFTLDRDWESRANCKGIPIEEFYSWPGGHPPHWMRKLCNECPVQQECLEDTLQFEMARGGHRHDIHGFVGGKAANERYREIRRRKEAGYGNAA